MRPTINPLFLALLVEQVPSRVRKRLDGDPAVAKSWPWSANDEGWTIQCNDETVHLRASQGVLSDVSQVACSCLMSPRCFHILACCSCLALQAESGDARPSEQLSSSPERPDSQLASTSASTSASSPSPRTASEQLVIAEAACVVTTGMRTAAGIANESIAALLGIGARHAGLLVQSSLLRAAHACRAAELYTLGNTMLRIAEGVQRFRHQSDEADSNALADDVASALAACHSLLNNDSVPTWIVGQARRVFHSIDTRRLIGIFAEPVLTRSGFAGVTVYFQDANRDRLLTVNELRTGDAGLVRQAYRGGIDLGSLTLDAKTLSRIDLSVQELSASTDGRLAKGKSTLWAVAQRESLSQLVDGRFAMPIDQQLKQVCASSNLPESQRPVGWDLMAFDATILGAQGSTVVASVEGIHSPWRLCIAIDSPELEFRHNLELLCRCAQLRVRCLGRIRWTDPGSVDWLAIEDTRTKSIDPVRGDPSLALPEDWHRVCNLGLDRLERHYLRGVKRWPDETILDSLSPQAHASARYTSSLSRRLVGMVLGGRDAIAAIGSKSHRRDHAQIEAIYLTNAARLIDLLSMKAHAETARRVYDSSQRSQLRSELTTAYLACDTYVRTVQRSLAETGWQRP